MSLIAKIPDILKEAQEELQAAWEAAGGVCPLCGSEVKENWKSKDNGGFGPDSIDGNGSSRSDEWDCRGSYTGFISK